MPEQSARRADITDFLQALASFAETAPTRTAIVDETRTCTFADLWIEVSDRAAALLDAGVKPDHRIAIVAENSVDFLASAFAVWKVGAVLATIYPSTGAADIRYCINHSDPVLVLVDQQTSDTVREAVSGTMPMVAIEGPFTPPLVRADAEPSPSDVRGQLALICYTSGTTSRPKAIMHSKQAVFNGAETYAEVWRMAATDRTLVALPMAWLYGLNSTSMAALLRGGAVVSLRRSRPELLLRALREHRITVFPGVTTMFVKLVQALDGSDGNLDLTSLRLCVSGGEPRNETAFMRWTAVSGCPVLDTFCASECFPAITYDPAVDAVPVPGAAGKLVPRTEMRVVDAAGRDVATGEPGEALWRGLGLMLGYWKDSEATSRAITHDGWFRTRDLVQLDADGYVHVIGRLSDMIIRGGSNVSPAEVERVLAQSPDVRAACVVGAPDPIYGQQVVAGVVLQPGSRIDPVELRSLCASQLAAYKVPSAFVVLEQLPINATTGKVDRKRVASLLAEQVTTG